MSDKVLDDLLDSTLDDLADLPTFKPYPAGIHRVTIAFEEKIINKKPSVELKLTGICTEELSEPGSDDKPIEPGQETQVLYILKKDDGSANEVSQGKLKEVLAVLAEMTGVRGIRQVMEAAKGMEVLAVTKQRTNKETGTVNTDIVKVSAI